MILTPMVRLYGWANQPLSLSAGGRRVCGVRWFMKTFAEFFAWCEKNGLADDRSISNAFSCTHQTVHNWRSGRSRMQNGVPRHVQLQTIGFAAAKSGKHSLPPNAGMAEFDAWRAERGMGSLEATGRAFGLTRQAIHNWVKRERLPRWIHLACLGHDLEAGKNSGSNPNPQFSAI